MCKNERCVLQTRGANDEKYSPGDICAVRNKLINRAVVKLDKTNYMRERLNRNSSGRIKLIFAFILYILLGWNINLKAQNLRDTNLVQFSGVVMTSDNDTLIPLPFVNIQVMGTPRGTYSDFDGFFSVVASKGDTIAFSAVGFKRIDYVIPDTLHTDRYTIYQLLPKDTLLLPETVVYPWPSREHFRLEFLALNTDTQLDKNIVESLSKENVNRMLVLMPVDASEIAKAYFKEQQKRLYYAGQVPSPIDPMAWIRFFKAWRAGKFKKKKR